MGVLLASSTVLVKVVTRATKTVVNSVEQELYNEFGGNISLDEIEQMIKDHPQWSRDKLRQELLRKQLSEYSLVIVSSSGQMVTAMKNLTASELRLLGSNYGFNPNP